MSQLKENFKKYDRNKQIVENLQPYIAEKKAEIKQLHADKNIALELIEANNDSKIITALLQKQTEAEYDKKIAGLLSKQQQGIDFTDEHNKSHLISYSDMPKILEAITGDKYSVEMAKVTGYDNDYFGRYEVFNYLYYLKKEGVEDVPHNFDGKHTSYFYADMSPLAIFKEQNNHNLNRVALGTTEMPPEIIPIDEMHYDVRKRHTYQQIYLSSKDEQCTHDESYPLMQTILKAFTVDRNTELTPDEKEIGVECTERLTQQNEM